MNFEHIMHDAEKFPLSIHLGFTPQTESPQANRTADIGEHWLHDCESLAVAASPLRGIDLLFHLLRIGLRSICCATREKYYLARERALGMT